MTSEDELIALARRIATSAHANQTDKAGNPYIGHPERIANRLPGHAQAQAVAWLHDVVEDTAHDFDSLRQEGFPDDVIAAVDALTKRKSEEQDDEYYARVAANPLALQVKRADIADNTDPARLALLDPVTRERLVKKYKDALVTLDRLSGPPPSD